MKIIFFWKKTAAGLLALLIVAGVSTVAPFSKTFERSAVTASTIQIWDCDYCLVTNNNNQDVIEINDGETVVELNEGDKFVICNIDDYGWGGFGSTIYLPYVGGESTFGIGGLEFYVTQSGEYVITLTDKCNGNCFLAVQYPLANYCTVFDIPNQIYTGSEIELQIDIDTNLTLGTDYTIEYSNNTEAGTATAKIKGIGNYGGTIKKTFNIVRNVYLSDSIEHGTISSESYLADEGDAVTLTPPRRGLCGKERYRERRCCHVTDNQDGTYSFTTPDGDVTVSAEFVELELVTSIDEKRAEKTVNAIPLDDTESFNPYSSLVELAGVGLCCGPYLNYSRGLDFTSPNTVLILKNNAKLNILGNMKGVNFKNLYIYGQSGGTGEINVNSREYCFESRYNFLPLRR